MALAIMHGMQHEPASADAQIKAHEARAWLLARLQTGQDTAADAVFRQAVLAVRADPAESPLKTLWQTLADGCLARGGTPGHWEPALAGLQDMAPAPRLALLLRLLGRLDEVPAALVMGVSQERYRQLLGEAAPKTVEGAVDAAAWHALAERLQQALQTLPPRQTVRIAGMRAHAWQPQALVIPTGRDVAAIAESPRLAAARGWRKPLALVFLLAAVGALGWWSWTRQWFRDDPWHPHVRVEALPEAVEPAARFGSDAAVLAHPDFAQASAAVDAALLQELDLLAWYADKIAAPPPPAVIQPLPELPETTSEQTDASTL